MTNFINASYKLPDDEELCVLLLPYDEKITGDLIIGYMLDNEWYEQGLGVPLGLIVSHWMPLGDTAALVDEYMGYFK